MSNRYVAQLQRLACAFHSFVNRCARSQAAPGAPHPPRAGLPKALAFRRPVARTPAIIPSSLSHKSIFLSRNFSTRRRRVRFFPFEVWEL